MDNTRWDPQNSKYFPVFKGVLPFRCLFFCSPNMTSYPQVFLVNGSITCSRLHFFDIILTSLVQYDKTLMSSIQYDKVLSKFGQQQLVMVNYASGFNQSDGDWYFEWIIKDVIARSFGLAVNISISLRHAKIPTEAKSLFHDIGTCIFSRQRVFRG